MKKTYLDYNATAPVRPQVQEATTPILFGGLEGGLYGNASSVHWAGQAARRQLESARTELAELLGCKPGELLFTSGGSEADNLALSGVLLHNKVKHPRLIISAVEHPAVRGPARTLEAQNVNLTEISVDAEGRLDLEALQRALNEGATLVSVMAVNNETGVIMELEPVVEMVKAAGALLHVDAVQAVGKIALPKADLLSFSGHKLGGLKGVGGLVVKDHVPLKPLIVGGPQERGKRAGTEHVAAAVGLAVALKQTLAEREEAKKTQRSLRDQIDALLMEIPGTQIVAQTAPRVFNTTTAVFDDVDGESILQALDLEGIAASSGSACSSGSLEPSHVLAAMGFSEEKALSALRFSLGWGSSQADIDRLRQVLPAVIAQVRV